MFNLSTRTILLLGTLKIEFCRQYIKEFNENK